MSKKKVSEKGRVILDQMEKLVAAGNDINQVLVLDPSINTVFDPGEAKGMFLNKAREAFIVRVRDEIAEVIKGQDAQGVAFVFPGDIAKMTPETVAAVREIVGDEAMVRLVPPAPEPAVFTGIILDESSILKHHGAATRTALIDAFYRTPYRLACTATPAPNDWSEPVAKEEEKPSKEKEEKYTRIEAIVETILAKGIGGIVIDEADQLYCKMTGAKSNLRQIKNYYLLVKSVLRAIKKFNLPV